MCGICGVFEYRTGQPVERDQVQRMTDMLEHRGPDEEGFLIQPGIALGMRRLSVIDLAGGQQPIPNEDGSIWIILNGEIYNYQALQKQLVQRNHRLRTNSDTEVILHLYEEYGVDCVHHLDGMFAFAIYDQGSNGNGPRLLIARDRLGKKPLYYADVGGGLIFASEIKPILQDPRVSRELDFEALHHYLSLLMIPAPLSIFRDVRKLPAGHFLECDSAGVKVRRYWNYSDYVAHNEIPKGEAVAEIRRLLFSAVEKRLIAEVPLGAFLSGGLDSSTIVAIMSRLKQEPVKTFSIGFEGPEAHNELPHARVLARHYQTDHHEYLVKPDVVKIVEEIVRYADEPFAISSAIPTLLMSKAASQDVTVVLTGDGGDEIFGGYETYLYERWAAAYRHLPVTLDLMLTGFASVLTERVGSRMAQLGSRVTRFAKNARLGLGQRRLGWASGFSEFEKQTLYSRPNNRCTSTATFLEKHAPTNSTHSSLSPVVRQNNLDIVVWLPDEMLAKVDRMTMAASVEARCPLLDLKLVEYMAGLSFDLKIPGWRRIDLKHLLREAVADLIPPNLLRRPKHGFNVPLDVWFRGGAKDYLKAMLSPERVRRRGLFNTTAISDLLIRHQTGRVNASNRLYALLVFEVWAETYL